MKISIIILALLILRTLPALASPISESDLWGIDAGGFKNLSTALTSPKTLGKTIIVSQPMTINNKTVGNDRELKIIKGGVITVASEKTLVINCPISIGKYQVFSGTGTVTGLTETRPEWWGAAADMFTDCTVAIQSAINSLSKINGGTVLLSGGYYKTTSELVVKHDFVHIRGQGGRSSIILFNPSVDGTALRVDKGNLIFQGSIKGVGFYSIDSKHKKIALDLVDTSGYIVEDIYIAGSIGVLGGEGTTFFWTGGGSIGIRCRGRELSNIKNLYIAAESPLVIAKNPYWKIDNDHHHFTDCYFIANGKPNVTIESGLWVTELLFDGQQAWVLGSHGLYWNDTTATLTSTGIVIRNVRTEQGTDANAYSFYIAHHIGVYGLAITNNYMDPGRKGIYLRGAVAPTLTNTILAGPTEGLNIDSTVRHMTISAAYWPQGTTSITSGQRVLWASPSTSGIETLMPNMILDAALGFNNTLSVGAAMSSPTLTLRNNEIAIIGNDSSHGVPGETTTGLAILTDNEGLSALLLFAGSQHVVEMVWAFNNSNYHSVVAGTDNKTNVYWSSSKNRYEIENKRLEPDGTGLLCLGLIITFRE